MIFKDRSQAGQLLSQKLQRYIKDSVIVLALPRGGVPVAAEIANALGAPLDVLIVRKVGAPNQAELAVGAVCEEAEPVWNEAILAKLRLEPAELGRTLAMERQKIEQQTRLFRDSRKFPLFNQKTVILVDDGLATGATMSAAVKYLRGKSESKIIAAVPVAAASSARILRGKVENLVVIEEREDLMSVGQWYEDFSQVSDAEVVALLKGSGDPSKKATREVDIVIERIKLLGDLTTFPSMKAVIIFAHGSGSSRKSPRNQYVAQVLNDKRFGTLLFDLLSEREAQNMGNVFNMELLSTRLALVTLWLRKELGIKSVPLGFFGASTGAGAAIQAAVKLMGKESIFALVSRGGRPDLAGDALKLLKAPTLLLVGGQDYSVIELNRKAQRSLSNCILSIVPGATHLFDEPNTLEEVSMQAAQWFVDQLSAQKLRDQGDRALKLQKAILHSMVPLDDHNEESLDGLIQSIKNKRVVMLGEASHGTEEFYRWRSQISKRLIKDHGFNFIAVEGNWPDFYRLHKYIQSGEGRSAKEVLMLNHRWPTWMWANEEVARLAEWMRINKAGFYGLDVYSLFESVHEVIKYLSKNEPLLAEEVGNRYACFEAFQGDEVSYARSLIKYPDGCQNEAIQNLQKLLELAVKNSIEDSEEFFSSQQNAHIVVNAEAYYRAMSKADASSWNIRDGHMMETLDRLLEWYGHSAKAIVWAHNTHIGDYRATDMNDRGYVNIGGLARLVYGDDCVALVGFGTYQGEVLAGHAWGGKEQVMRLPQAREKSYEHYFHLAAAKNKVKQFYIPLKDKSNTPFLERLGHRAVGVVYDPRHEQRGNYVPTQLSKRYDAFIFIDRTHSLKSLHAGSARGELPATWPSGQ